MKKILLILLSILSIGTKGQVVVYGNNQPIVYHSWVNGVLQCSYTDKGSMHYFVNGVLYCSATKLPVPGQSINVSAGTNVYNNAGGNIINAEGYKPYLFENNSWSVDNGKYSYNILPVVPFIPIIPNLNFGNIINAQGYNPWLFGDRPYYWNNYYFPRFRNRW